MTGEPKMYTTSDLSFRARPTWIPTAIRVLQLKLTTRTHPNITSLWNTDLVYFFFLQNVSSRLCSFRFATRKWRERDNSTLRSKRRRTCHASVTHFNATKMSMLWGENCVKPENHFTHLSMSGFHALHHFLALTEIPERHIVAVLIVIVIVFYRSLDDLLKLQCQLGFANRFVWNTIRAKLIENSNEIS